VGWGTQLTDALRKAAAAVTAAQQQPAEAAANGGGDAVQQPAAPQDAAGTGAATAIMQAACAAAAELFSRLQPCIELPAARREVSSMVPKLLQQLQGVLGGSSSSQRPDSCHIAALQLLAALLRCVPSSLRQGAASLERSLQQLVLRTAASSAGSSVAAAGGPTRRQLLAQAALCTALLPAAPGDAAAWSETGRRLLLSCHSVLDHLLMGLESRPLDAQYRAHLTGGGTVPAAAAGSGGAQAQAAAAANSAWLPSLPWQQQQAAASATSDVQRKQTVPALLLLSTCLSALQQLLQQPFSAAVPVPGYSLTLLAARLLRFDAGAAVAAGAVPASSTMYQELLVLQPQLQAGGWQLLQLVVASCGAQLQLQGTLLRMVRQGLRAVQLSGAAALLATPVAVRCCMYATAAQAVRGAGLAGVRACAAEVMGCVVLELYGQAAPAGGGGGGDSHAAAGQGRPAKRSRKSGGASGTELGQFDPAAAAAAVAGSASPAARLATAADLPAQAAALRLLRQLLEAGGQLLPPDVRAHADAVAYHISQTAAEAALCLQQQPGLSDAAAQTAGALASMQVAAYEALLSSVLVPCPHRPPFLSQAVTLFRQGHSSRSAALAGVCQAAAVQCEVLLHPRATPMSAVRQYAGMDALPALSKPLFWSVLLPSAVVARAPAPAAAAGGGNGLQQHPGAAAGAAANGPLAAPARLSGSGLTNGPPVVMGYPVHGQAAAGGREQQQQRPLAAAGAGGQHSGGEQLQVAPSALPPAAVFQPAGRLQQQANTAAAAAAAATCVEPMETEEQQQPERQLPPALRQPGSSGPTPGVTAAAGGSGQQLPTPAPAPAAVAGALFDEESSDSEGPLPDIDSGDEASD
jgi:proline/glutamate/leucine-rich protein 1